jgi:DNA topoisomerase-1
VEGSDDPNAELGDQEVVLPDLKVGQLINARAKANAAKDVYLDRLTNKRHDTVPPARYTEASLVKKLEEESIGRPSTYASIISTIQDRGYIYVNKSRQLIPTFTAIAVTNLLRKHFSDYVDIKFTARMEEELDQIAEGKMTWLDHVKAFYRGTKSEPGLERIVSSKSESIEFPTIPLGTDPKTGEPVEVRIGRNGPYLMRGVNGNATTAPIPDAVAPADLTLEKALALINAKAEGPRKLGTDPKSGLIVYAMTGRFGAYVQLGETPEDKKAAKPRRASLEKGMDVETVTLEDALRLLAFPRELGAHPETGKPILANKGKYGPYVQHDSEFRSIKGEDDVYTITLTRALELLAEPKQPRSRGAASKIVLKDLGKSPDGASVQVLEGRYGPYVTDGTSNATVPKGDAPESVTMEQALALLAARAKSNGGAKKGKKAAPAKKKAPAKKSKKKSG